MRAKIPSARDDTAGGQNGFISKEVIIFRRKNLPGVFRRKYARRCSVFGRRRINSCASRRELCGERRKTSRRQNGRGLVAFYAAIFCATFFQIRASYRAAFYSLFKWSKILLRVSSTVIFRDQILRYSKSTLPCNKFVTSRNYISEFKEFSELQGAR